MRHHLLSWAALWLAVAVLPAEAASFSCTKASRPDETAVCAHPELSALDSEMGGLWFAYSRFPFLMGSNGVRHDETRQFLQDRAACAADVACLRKVYGARIAALQDGVKRALAGSVDEQQAMGGFNGLPGPVAGIITGYAQQCQQLGGELEATQPFMLIGDIDSDGQADYLLDPQNIQCRGAATAFCGNGGCQISIALSSNGYADPLAVLGGQPTLIQGASSVDVAIWVDGTNCHLAGKDLACWANYSWSGGKLKQTYATRPNPG
jgi:uncharacterized protein